MGVDEQLRTAPSHVIVTIAAAALGWLPDPADRVFIPVVPA